MGNALCLLTYNSARQLTRTWPTFVQPKHPLRIIIVDNASTDGTVAMFQKAGFSIEANPTNTYYTAGINQAISLALKHDPEWVFLLNPDTLVPPEWDEILLGDLTSNDSVGIVGCRLTTPDGAVTHTGGTCGKPKPAYWQTYYQLGDGLSVIQPDVVMVSRYYHAQRDFSEPYECPWVTFAAVALRAEMLREVGLLDEYYRMYCSDTDYCLRAAKFGWKTVCNVKATFIHEGGASVKQAGSETHEICKADLRRFALTEG